MAFPTDLAERNQYIIEQVYAGNFQLKWQRLSSTIEGHTATFWVMGDALIIEGVRVDVSATVEQEIADAIGASLLTAKLADLIFEQAVGVIGPSPQPITSSTQGMIDHSARVDHALAAIGNPEGIVATVGKHWIIDNRLNQNPGRAMNYGWFFRGTSYQGIQGYPCASGIAGVSVIQPAACAHDPSHVDYSQICRLVHKSCIVDGRLSTLADVLGNPELAALASHQGVITVLRHPGVPEPVNPPTFADQVALWLNPPQTIE